MRSRHLLAALLVGLGLALPAAVPARDAADAARIKKLVEQLGSAEFQERENAVKELGAIGEPALEALRKAAASDDAEVKTRASQLVTKIERRAESARELAATRVRLVYKDTPLAEAVADLRKKTGYDIGLYDPDGKLKDRKVTLDTGETTFWHAFDQFCQKAGLVEATPEDMMKLVPVPPGPAFPGAAPALPAPPPLPRPPKDRPRGPAAARFKAAGALAAAEQGPDRPVRKLPAAPALPVAAPAPPGLPGPGPGPGAPGLRVSQIALIDGKAKAVPSDDSTAVRVRASGDARPLTPANDGEILLALEATPEPKLQWLTTEGVKVEKAVDDQGQSLSQAAEARPAGPGGGPPVPPRAAVFIPGVGWGASSQLVPVRLKKGEKAAKTIKELKGVITAQVLTGERPFITVEDVAKAAGKTVKGRHGGSIKILEVSKGEKDQVTVRFELEQPEGVIPAMGPAGGWGAVGVPPPGGPLPPPAAVPVVPPPPAPAKRPALPPGALVAVEEAEQAPPPPPVTPPAPPPLPAPPPPGVRFGGAGMGMPGFGGYHGLTLQDEKGNNLPCQVRNQWRAPAAGAGRPQMEYVLTYTAKKDVAARLVYSGRRTITIDVPFTLKDVAIP
jgi:hypothetical protein